MKLVDDLHNVGKAVYSVLLIVPSLFSSQKKRKSELDSLFLAYCISEIKWKIWNLANCAESTIVITQRSQVY